MGFDLTNIKSITTPSGNVKQIAVGGIIIWKKESAPVDKYSWEAVLASINAGTYATDYAIGDLIPINLGSEGLINMQIVGFDVDDRADGNGKAHISFISKELLNTSHRMNPARTPSAGPFNEGTGSIGGWEKSEMRTYLKNTIKPLIPIVVMASIVDVIKTQPSLHPDISKYTQETIDDLWITSKDEIESKYKNSFPDLNSLRKYKLDSSRVDWWTRGSYGSNSFEYIYQGSFSGSAANTPLGIALGFCL